MTYTASVLLKPSPDHSKLVYYEILFNSGTILLHRESVPTNDLPPLGLMIYAQGIQPGTKITVTAYGVTSDIQITEKVTVEGTAPSNSNQLRSPSLTAITFKKEQ